MGAREPSRKAGRKDVAAVVQLDAAYLRRLGERVREARARRGMTRKHLARDSGVSERYLAQLEAGKGNVSVLLLRQIAAGAQPPGHRPVREENGQPVELALIQQFLKRLPAASCGEVRARLAAATSASSTASARQAHRADRPARRRQVHARRQLAAQRGVPFVELDREIEREAGTSLNEIFLLHGQAGYRRYERRALVRMPRTNERGDDDRRQHRERARAPSTCCFDLLHVWLKANPEEHMAASSRKATSGRWPATARRWTTSAASSPAAKLYARADAVVDTAARSAEATLNDLRARSCQRRRKHQGEHR